MPLYYGIILPKELFWTTLAESYIKNKGNKKRTFKNPISELLYLLNEEFGDEENELNDEVMEDIELNALNILDKDDWNLRDGAIGDFFYFTLPNDYIFVGENLNTEDDTLYIIDNLETKEIKKIDKFLNNTGFENIEPKFYFLNGDIYGGRKLKVEGLEYKNKI